MTTQPAATATHARPPGTIRRAVHFTFRTVVCVVTFITVFSLCEGVKDLLLR